MQFDVGRRADDAELRRLLRENPVDGSIRVTLEREPDSFLAAGIEGDTHQVVVARDSGTGRLLGMGTRSVNNAYINGQRERLGYLSQLRLDRDHCGRPDTRILHLTWR